MNSENQPYATNFPALFARNVAAQPDRLALVTTTCAITYAELNAQADRIAAALFTVAGRGPAPIGLLFGQEIAAFAATIAVLKSGNFYVTLDPLYPLARLAEILTDAGAGVLLTNTACLALAQQLCPEGVVIVAVDALPTAVASLPSLVIAADAYAYIGYTSGSTGKAKGVIETHGNHICHWQNLLRAQPNYGRERVLFLNRLSFSGGQLAFYLTLLAGATLYLYDLHTDGIPALPAWIQQHQITVWNSVPSVFRAFVAQVAGPEQVASIRLLRLASDAILPQDLAAYRRLFSPSCQLWLCYALTEVKTVTMTFLARDVPILPTAIPSGPPIDGMAIQIVDETGQPLGPDQVGEIIVRSRYVSPGYWRDPELTAARFRPDPAAPGVFLVQTGDLGKLDHYGNLIHKGRKDTQVKVRGYRVELSEIEAHLSALDGVQEAAVRAYPLASGEVRLAAYWVSHSSSPPSSSHLRRLLSQHLPDYMLPASFTLVERLPVNRNGKIDRAALPIPSAERQMLDTPFVLPCTVLEQQLAAIWSELLTVESIGIHDNFFEIGGDSLAAMQVIFQVKARFAYDLPLTFFHQPTVARLAQLISGDRIMDAEAPPKPDVAPLHQPAPVRSLRSRLARLLYREPTWRGHALPYGIGVRLQRRWIQYPPVRQKLWQQSAVLREWFTLLGRPDPDEAELELSMLANSWRRWRTLCCQQPATFARWIKLTGGEHLAAALVTGRPIVLVGTHTAIRNTALKLVIEQQAMRPLWTLDYTPSGPLDAITKVMTAHERLRQGGLVLVTGDGAQGKQGIELPIGGQRWLFRVGGAELALDTGAILLPVFNTLVHSGHITVSFFAPFATTAQTRPRQVEELTRQYAALLEYHWPQLLSNMNWNKLSQIGEYTALRLQRRAVL